MGYVDIEISVRCSSEDIEEAAEYQSLGGKEFQLEVYPGNSGDAEHDNTHDLDTGSF